MLRRYTAWVEVLIVHVLKFVVFGARNEQPDNILVLSRGLLIEMRMPGAVLLLPLCAAAAAAVGRRYESYWAIIRITSEQGGGPARFVVGRRGYNILCTYEYALTFPKSCQCAKHMSQGSMHDHASTKATQATYSHTTGTQSLRP